MVSDFACSHCQDFHRNDLKRFINDYVLTGKATLQLVMLSGTGGAFSDTATMGALCAGEQGAFWEMSDELFRLASAMAPEDAFRESQINKSANAMGLDGGKVLSCISSGRYASFLSNFRRFSNDHGITGTPTVLVSYGDGVWTAVSRDYDTLKSLTEKANAQSQ
jgi:protein-disulfide isomerase